MQITLTVIAGPYTGQTFTFDRPERFLVGRSSKAHFRLKLEKDKDLRVSRMQFLIEVNPPLCRLHDLKSRNGTHVNDQRVDSCDLANGDRIRVGQTVLCVTIAAAHTVRDVLPWPKPADGVSSLPLPSPPASLPLPLPLAPGTPCLCCSREPPEADCSICAECSQRAAGQPQPIPGYLVLREVAKGCMGVVHLALRQADQQPVAVKTIRPAGTPPAGVMVRFLREANILRELSHQHIVAFHELGEAAGLIYFVMDYVVGSDAGRLIQERGPLSPRVAVRLIIQSLEALEYAHARHFVHRDIKPANILLETVNQRLRVKVADFGLARIYQTSQLSGLTLRNDMGGTLEFMPPEQLTSFRDVQPAADQYAAAATLYNLLTGQFIRDLSGHIADRAEQILTRDAVPIRQRRPQLAEELAAVIHRALEREPSRRYPSVTDFRRALRPFAT